MFFKDKPWDGPFGGVPDWSMPANEYPQAFDNAMDELKDCFEAILRTEPSFDQTFNALNHYSQNIERLHSEWGVMTNNISDAEIAAIDEALSAKIATFYSTMFLDPRWAARIKTIWENMDRDGLSEQERRIVQEAYDGLIAGGAFADEPTKKRLIGISAELNTLFAQFSQNSLADEEKTILLPDGREIPNTRSSVQPILQNDPDRETRRIAYEAFASRGSETNPPIIRAILALRDERAKLLGFANHAEYRMRSTMAKEPAAATQLLMGVWDKALIKFESDSEFIASLADHDLEPWDYTYYSEIARKVKCDFDENDVRPYLQLDNMVEAMFYVASECFDMVFSENTGKIPVFHPDVRTFEVYRKSDGQHIGVFYFDTFARQGKRSGAWMTSYRDQSFLMTTNVLASNNNNFIKGDGVTLLGLDDAVTLFHEFGHAIHYLSAQITYPDLLHVPRDFVELPSQLFERWLMTPEVLSRFAIHAETGEPIPSELADKIIAASAWGASYDKIEFLLCALADMELHTGGNGCDFEERTAVLFDRLGKPKLVGMRHRLPHFSHLFSSDAYSAGYYSYMWADVMVADVWEAITADGPPLGTNSVVQRYRDILLQTGNETDRGDAYVELMGRKPDASALARSLEF